MACIARPQELKPADEVPQVAICDTNSLADLSLSSLLPSVDAALPVLDANLPDLYSPLPDLDHSSCDLEPAPSQPMADFCIAAVLSKPNIEHSGLPSVDEERPVDYSRTTESPPPSSPADAFLEAPLSPCVVESPQKLGRSGNDSGYLSSCDPASPPSFSAHANHHPHLIQPPSRAQLEYLHSQWSTETSAEPGRPDDSYTTMIGRALMSVPEQEMVISDIYAYIMHHYPYYKTAKSSWKSTVRHNLSCMDCFVRGRRSRTGRGYNWGIHPSFVKNFEKGYFNRRMASMAAENQPKSSRVSTGPRCSPLNGAQSRPGSTYGGMTSTPVHHHHHQSTHYISQPVSQSPVALSAQERFAAMQASCAQVLGYQHSSYIRHTMSMDMNRR